MCIIIFEGDKFLPEYPDSYDNKFGRDITTTFGAGNVYNYKVKYSSVVLDANNKITGGIIRSGRN